MGLASDLPLMTKSNTDNILGHMMRISLLAYSATLSLFPTCIQFYNPHPPKLNSIGSVGNLWTMSNGVSQLAVNAVTHEISKAREDNREGY